MSLISAPGVHPHLSEADSTLERRVPARPEGLRVHVTATELPASSPALVYEALVRDRAQDDVYLFESLDGPAQDRHSAVVGWNRIAELRLYADRVELTASGVLGVRLADVVSTVAGETTAERGGLRVWTAQGSAEVWRLLRTVQGAFDVETDVPESTFAFGFLTTLAYEAGWDMERLPQSQKEPDRPRCTLALFQNTVWYDLHTGGVRLLTASGDQLPSGDDRLPDILTGGAVQAHGDSAVPDAPAPRSVRDNLDEKTFTERVGRCLQHIGVGDSYQIQIGHRIDVETDLTPYQVYQRLRHRNPSPYMYLVPWAGHTVIGASPELFIRVEGGRISMRPIAGTAPRAADGAEDARRVAELRGSAKEQAEHIMLVDLCRNDIGRVCLPGTLSVDVMMEVEPFAYVHHLVSTVSGQIDDTTDIWTAVCATFPAGTMTGAPKVRAMEIINDIEDDPRGIYAGALGLVDVRGFAMLTLCIRTAVHDGERYMTQASAGVVADSVPAAEWRETLAKLSPTYWALTGEELLP
ncbi:anthranilate synthase component I family protein [Streptomyces sp. SCA3-4]|uniref:anthranilate synthase component I family protein n=1 Tax=Streptomyces sichuanensis TaxID=2871810 RepID=UPI001CE2902F|nr:anthranilate synthase component I family protein [Streptomyces sichuanensis]MCA6095471.1 anthranilate synthase component I family protein [Streptomyces sichuanensis]